MAHHIWEYLSVRFSFKTRARYQEFSYLIVDGDTLRPEWDESLVATLPELLNSVGRDGWELVTHATTSAGHYMHFKRQGSVEKLEANQEAQNIKE